MVNPSIPVILINSIVIQEYANKNSGYQISIIIQNIPQQQAYTEQLLDIQNNQGQGIGDDFEKKQNKPKYAFNVCSPRLTGADILS